MSNKIESSEINSSHVKSSYNSNNQNNPNFEELISSSLDESNNQILLYALDTESGETKIVTIPL
jgi:adenine-specific DNA methylase